MNSTNMRLKNGDTIQANKKRKNKHSDRNKTSSER